MTKLAPFVIWARGKGMAKESESKALATLIKGLEWVYDRAVMGAPGLDSASDLAATYRQQYATPDEAIEALIKWQIAKAATAGFLTNLGGTVTLPVALPANLVSALYIQIRMIAAIAEIRGHDIHSDQVRTFVLACLCGTSVMDVVKDFSVMVGTGLAQQAVMHMSAKTLRKINHAVALFLLTKTGTTATLNLSKLLPLIGGVISGALDGVLTRAYGATAKRLFLPILPAPVAA
jgi:uncharacterized protein (DUF697 family)